MSADNYDVVVIGGGAAGLSAALVLGRSRRRVAVVDAGEPRNAPAAHVHGFLTQEGTPPHQLLALARAELGSYDVELVEGVVERVGQDLTVNLRGGGVLAARKVVVATGAIDVLPDIPGLQDRWGIDLLQCPYCHGWEVRDAPIAVLGTHPAAVHHALLLRQWSSDLVYFPHASTLTAEQESQLAARGIGMEPGIVTGLTVTSDRISAVALDGGRDVPRSTVFVMTGMPPRDEFLTELAPARDERGYLIVEAGGRTSLPGVWAAGNVVDPRAQVVTAAGMGSATAFMLHADLVREDVNQAVAEAR